MHRIKKDRIHITLFDNVINPYIRLECPSSILTSQKLASCHLFTDTRHLLLVSLAYTYNSLAMPTSKSKLYHISPPPLISRDSDEGTDQTSMVEPHDDELSDSGWTEVPDREWSDEQLLDDARPGRRKGDRVRGRARRMREERW
jgi:hypothetical protein